MSGVLIVAGVADADFAEEVRKTTRGLDIEIARALPAGEQRTVLLVWSAAQPATVADVPTLIELWSQGRLVISRRDDTPLPLGLGDLETVPAGAPARETAFKLLHATLAPGDAAEASGSPPAPPLEAPTPEPVAVVRPKRRWPIVAAVAVLLLVVAGGLASWMQLAAPLPMAKSAGPEEAALRRIEAETRMREALSQREQRSGEERDSRLVAERAAREQPRPTAAPPPPPPPLSSAQPTDDARIADLERQIAALSRERAAGTSEGLSWVVWAAGAGGAAVTAILLLLFQRQRRPSVVGIASMPAAKPVPAAALPPDAAGESLFVSYAHHDRLLVDPLVHEIEGLGRAVWIDRTGMTGGPGWAGQIARAIKGSRAVVLMASPSAYASDQVVRELYLAMGSKKIIVPIELEPADLPDELAYILAPFQRHALAGDPRTMLMRALEKV
ncbi:MAG: toll/interleukin-1 receptor domain-containing protein [Reyranella sp.]|uniref:toll/interleukin-1 receptor domain-containing protein n=1 Tax=Reyranella sp. TaxID=1929291 RepID=UPI0012173A38|nr:toll/interleukin-1 receptor domain-containing protein [Reyranella sp.]TAJ36715.1 MAG: toll/interleukin-1 receptor domain-containing protein [Reyranella sp.]